MPVKIKDKPGDGLTALVIGHHPQIKAFLQQEGFGISKGQSYWDYDVVFFGGGPDVSPFLYGQKTLPSTTFSMKRDFEENLAYRTIPDWVPKIGICRGAQFLCVMNGGSLFQDVKDHRKSHSIIDKESGEVIDSVTSTHHQMMDPAYLGNTSELIAYSNHATQRTDDEGEYIRTEKSNWVEPEVVWFPYTLSLAVQFHPEYASKNSSCREYFFNVVERTLGEYLNPNLKPEEEEVA